jgi:hypothetical protein
MKSHPFRNVGWLPTAASNRDAAMPMHAESQVLSQVGWVVLEAADGLWAPCSLCMDAQAMLSEDIHAPPTLSGDVFVFRLAFR